MSNLQDTIDKIDAVSAQGGKISFWDAFAMYEACLTNDADLDENAFSKAKMFNFSDSELFGLVVKASIEDTPLMIDIKGNVFTCHKSNHILKKNKKLMNVSKMIFDIFPEEEIFSVLRDLYKGTDEGNTWGQFWDDVPTMENFVNVECAYDSYKESITIENERIYFGDDTAKVALNFAA